MLSFAIRRATSIVSPLKTSIVFKRRLSASRLRNTSRSWRVESRSERVRHSQRHAVGEGCWGMMERRRMEKLEVRRIAKEIYRALWTRSAQG
jgi:hypothetical protein